jgi:hypothetical protein
MYEWKVNQIKVGMMERVLNHMEKQGYQVQTIIPLSAVAEDTGGGDHQGQMLLAGKKETRSNPAPVHRGMPALKPENLDVVYGRKQGEKATKDGIRAP